MKFKILLFLSLYLASFIVLKAQVFINEIMVNDVGGSNGSNMPNTSEWVELYNAGTSSVNISCWFLTDGDVSITFPSVTTIAAGAYYTIASAVGCSCTPNLNWTACGGCVAGAAGEIVVFTDGGEQVLLYNNAATPAVVDAVIWGPGPGQLSTSAQSTHVTSTITPCGAISVSLATFASGLYESIPTSTNGISKERSYDGGPTWQNTALGGATFGTSNGPFPLPIELLSFSSSAITECESEISWQTASEINSNYYTVYKSKNAINYAEVGKVTSYNSQYGANYKLYDTHLDYGITYYKLTHTDFDNTLQTQAPIYLENNLAKQNVLINYNNTDTKIKFKNTHAILDATIIDAAGRVIKQLSKTEISNGFLTYNADVLPSGIYFIKINYNSEVVSDKFIVK